MTLCEIVNVFQREIYPWLVFLLSSLEYHAVQRTFVPSATMTMSSNLEMMKLIIARYTH